MAVIFASGNVKFIFKHVTEASKRVRLISKNVISASLNVNLAFQKVTTIAQYVNRMFQRVNLVLKKHISISTIGDYAILTDKENPLRFFDLQAHWAGAKRQQHLPKELVLLYLISTSSIIHQIHTRQHETRNQNA